MMAQLQSVNIEDKVLAGLSNWLLETGAKDESLVVAGEALDKFIDVYSEDTQDDLFARLGLLQKTRHALNAFKIRLDQQKGQIGSALPLLKCVLTCSVLSSTNRSDLS